MELYENRLKMGQKLLQETDRWNKKSNDDINLKLEWKKLKT